MQSQSAETPAAGVTAGFSSRGGRLKTIGLYIEPAGRRDAHRYDFYKACGYNYLEFCDTAFARRPDLIDGYCADMSEAIVAARQRGFKVWILLLACMKQWKGLAPTGDAGAFSAVDRGMLEERLRFLAQTVRGLRAADGFSFFCGDPGGDPQGRATIRDCMQMADRVRKIVRKNAPAAGFTVNLWAVAEWGGYPSAMSLAFWKQQVRLSRIVAGPEGILGPDCGVVFSMDNYYRSLALTCYDDAGERPELFPTAADVDAMRQRGVRNICGWPYFLVDEIDDGFITPNNVASGGQAQAETRYLRAVVDRGREIGLDGMIANASHIGRLCEPLNIYAFAQMCLRPDLTPEAALDEYAAALADERTRGSLARVLRFVENHSNWHNSLPPQYRLKVVSCGDVSSAATALARLKEVVPLGQSPLPLPEPPAEYLKRIEKRLQAIAAGKIGGTAPISRTPKKGGP